MSFFLQIKLSFQYQEKRLIQFPVEETKLKKDTTEPDFELKEFIREQNKINDSSNRKFKDSFLLVPSDSLWTYKRNFSTSLGSDFGSYASPATIRCGISISKSDLAISMVVDSGDHDPESLKILIAKPDWSELARKMNKLSNWI